MYNQASYAATSAGNQITPSSGGGGNSAAWINAGAQALRSGIEAMGSQRASGHKEQKRRTKAEHLLNLLRKRLESEDETRRSQNGLSMTLDDILQNKAAQFRQSLM